MAVDIKTLRIGSHILVNGKRERVRGLDEDNGLIVRFPAEYVMTNEVEPIPITPALLEELRFINTRWSGRRIVYTNGNEDVDPWIEFKNLKDRWKLVVCNNGWQGQTVVRYLHEAEAFLGLHNVELINENKKRLNYGL